jgi:hypothetical protein
MPAERSDFINLYACSRFLSLSLQIPTRTVATTTATTMAARTTTRAVETRRTRLLPAVVETVAEVAARAKKVLLDQPAFKPQSEL